VTSADSFVEASGVTSNVDAMLRASGMHHAQETRLRRSAESRG
jgi:hypothetical protein